MVWYGVAKKTSDLETSHATSCPFNQKLSGAKNSLTKSVLLVLKKFSGLAIPRSVLKSGTTLSLSHTSTIFNILTSPSTTNLTPPVPVPIPRLLSLHNHYHSPNQQRLHKPTKPHSSSQPQAINPPTTPQCPSSHSSPTQPSTTYPCQFPSPPTPSPL